MTTRQTRELRITFHLADTAGKGIERTAFDLKEQEEK